MTVFLRSIFLAKPQYVGIGCFKEGRGKYRVLPNLIKNLRPQINCGKLNATVEPCARLASEHDVKYFAIQFYGECWASSNATAQFDKYGPSEKCWDGVGGKGTNYVYKLIKKPCKYVGRSGKGSSERSYFFTVYEEGKPLHTIFGPFAMHACTKLSDDN